MQDSFDARAISRLVQDALTFYSDHQNNRDTDNLMAELEGEVVGSMRSIQGLVDSMARQERVWVANDMEKSLASGSVPPGKYNWERWVEIQALFRSFARWLKTPIDVLPPDESGYSALSIMPVVIISRRGNPAPMWGIGAPPSPVADSADDSPTEGDAVDA